MTPARPGPIRVMIVDDSASVRRALGDIVASDKGLEVFATAGDPYVAVEKMNRGMPDVMILDIELPRMDGITFLKRIMTQNPIPVVICSSHTTQGSEAMMKALEAGAVEVITKPAMNSQEAYRESARQICEAVRAAAAARLSNLRRRGGPPPPPVPPKQNADAVIPPLNDSLRPGAIARIPRTERIICIGASTGGPEALKVVLEGLPSSTPGIVIVQHMPSGFTGAFARRLDSLCAMSVKEAADGDVIRRGQVLIAPGNRHMSVQRRNTTYTVSVFDGPPVSRHRPSVDVLFRSAAQAAGPNATGALLTGMGDDGATGLLEMRQMGALTIAQDEATSVVFGMPKEAIARGAAELILPLERVAAALGAASARSAARA